MSTPLSRVLLAGAVRKNHPFTRMAVLAVVLTMFLLAPSIGGALPGRAGAPAAGSVGPPSIPAFEAPDFAPPAHLAPAGTIASVLSTLDLVSNRLLPGNLQPAVQSYPQTIVFDPVNHDLYIRGNLGNTVSVVNASTEQAITEIAVPYDQTSSYVSPMVVDSQNGNIYLTNFGNDTVAIVDGATNEVVGYLPVGGSPLGIALDPINHNLFVANRGSDNVTVFSATTDHLVATVPVGSQPESILYDPVGAEVFVANYGSANVSILDTNAPRVLANVATGTNPTALTFDSVGHNVDVANYDGGLASSLTVISDSTNAATGTYAVGSGPAAMAYDPASRLLFVANSVSSNVTVFNTSTDSHVAELAVGGSPLGIAFDPVNGLVYQVAYTPMTVAEIDGATGTIAKTVGSANFPVNVGIDSSTGNAFVINQGSSNVEANLTVIDHGTGSTTDSIPLVVVPYGVTVAPTTGQLFVADYMGNSSYRLNASTNLVDSVAPVGLLPENSVYDPVNGDLYIVGTSPSTITVITRGGASVATIPVGLGPTSIAYDSANGDLYVPSDYWGNVTVINATTNHVIGAISIKPYDNLRGILYDPDNQELYVSDAYGDNLTVIDGSTNHLGGSIRVGTFPAAIVLDPHNRTLFVANTGSGNLSVVSDASNTVVATVPMYGATYLAYDPASDLVYDAAIYAGEIAAINATTYASAGAPIVLAAGAYPEGIAYDPDDQELYVTNSFFGSVSILGYAGSVSSFPVWFNETGLPASTSWSVTFGGTPGTSSTASIGFTETNGTFGFSVAAVSGFAANVTAGTVVVAGAPRTVWIGFAVSAGPTPTYAVTFQETGLPQSTPWSVTFNGTPGTSTTPQIGFTSVNGTYSFSVGAVSGFTATPPSGMVTVDGVAATQDITFTALVVTAPLTVTLSAAPYFVVLGNSTNLTATATGGSSPYTFVYAGLPSGCSTQNRSSIPCQPAGTGKFTITVTVTDSSHRTATSNTTVTVTSNAGTGNGNGGAPASGSGGFSEWGWGLLLLVVVLVIAALLIRYARRKKPESAPPTAPPSP